MEMGVYSVCIVYYIFLLSLSTALNSSMLDISLSIGFGLLHTFYHNHLTLQRSGGDLINSVR